MALTLPFLNGATRKKRSQIIAVDLGSRTTKAVLFERRGDTLALTRYALLDAPVADKKKSPEQIARLQAVAAPDVRELRPEVSADAARLVRHMLTFDLNLRPAAWDDVLVALEGRVPGQSTPALQGNLGARLRRFAIVNPWILPLAVAGLLAAAVCARVIATSDESAAARFRVSKARAAALQSSGDIDGAREELRPFLRSVGDPAVEREAARLYDDLPPR